MQARGVVVEMPHGSGASVKVIANPVRLSATPPDYRLPPPMLGEHTEEICTELGYSPDQLREFRNVGVI